MASNRLTRRAFVSTMAAVGTALTLSPHVRAQPAGTPDQAFVLNFAPSEVCIVVSVSDASAAQDVYVTTLKWLNDAIGQIVAGANPGPHDPLDRELNPASLNAYAAQASAAGWLQPLVRGGIDPWVVLPTNKPQAANSVLLFFSVVVQPLTPDDAGAVVRRVVNLVNASLVQQGPSQVVVVQSATPNWLVVAASWFSCGGPGGKPEVAPAGTWDFHLPGVVAEWRTAAATAGDVGAIAPVVAVLDTCPAPDALASALVRAPENALLRWLSEHVALDDPVSLPIDAATPRGPEPGGGETPILPNWYGPERVATRLSASEFLVPDHGLFVAGVVHQIAPPADVRLIRVLGPYGVGTFHALASVLSRLPGALSPDGSRRIIVNLSVVVDIPPSDRIDVRWVPGLDDRWAPGIDSAERQKLLATPAGAPLRAALSVLDASLRVVVDWLLDQNVAVIAAAGNDAVPTANGAGVARPLPRFPARYPGVLSVAALTTTGEPTAYSNRATIPEDSPFGPPTSNGIAVLGGQAKLDTAWNGRGEPPPPSASRPPAGPPGWFGPRLLDVASGAGVVGAFSADRLPFSTIDSTARASVNARGWVLWAGTSFATPMVSGIAANILTLAPRSGPDRVRSLVQSIPERVGDFSAGLAERDLGCRGFKVTQG